MMPGSAGPIAPGNAGSGISRETMGAESGEGVRPAAVTIKEDLRDGTPSPLRLPIPILILPVGTTLAVREALAKPAAAA